jgi:hypothetical protein
MISYFLSFSWGIWIVISFIGWGTAINRLLFPQHRVDWGQRAAWGIAWSVIFGGLLNVTWTISQAAILIYICSGAVYGIIDAWRNKASLANKLNQLIKACQSNKFWRSALLSLSFWLFCNTLAAFIRIPSVWQMTTKPILYFPRKCFK